MGHMLFQCRYKLEEGVAKIDAIIMEVSEFSLHFGHGPKLPLML
jgi:hypothetical protein